MSKVLITGITSGQGKLVARRLLQRTHPYEVVGVDIHPWDDRPRGVTMAMADVRKRKFEDVIRRERPDVIVHLGSVRGGQDRLDDVARQPSLGEDGLGSAAQEIQDGLPGRVRLRAAGRTGC